ncbi:MAG: multicomponent Na+:H+ antiporter subunit F [Myxococcota bacterium]|jgi:multicomponent Na+:H+ antiporter subunit F
MIVAIIMLCIAMTLTTFAVVRGPGLYDRVVALDLLSVIAVGIAALESVRTGSTAFLDVALTIALVAFLGTLGAAAFGERRANGLEVDR